MTNRLKYIVWLVIILIGLVPTATNAAQDCPGGYCASGTSTTAGAVTDGCAPNTFCAIFTRNGGSKGLRVSLAFCDENGCNRVTTINGKNIKTYYDYYYSNGSTNYPQSFYYFGKTRLNASDLATIAIPQSSSYIRNAIVHSNSSLANENSIGMFTSQPNNNQVVDVWYTGIGDISKNATEDEYHKNINKLLAGFGIDKDDIWEQVGQDLAKGLYPACPKESLTCGGYRILVEPIFWWYIKGENTNWILTPTEVLYLSTLERSSGGHQVSINSYRDRVNSLYIPENNVYFKAFSRVGDAPLTTFKRAVENKQGGALNIVNPTLYYERTSCAQLKRTMGEKFISNLESEISRHYYAGTLKNYYVQKPSIPFGTYGQINTEWYVNECTCYGMYEYFDNQTIPSWKATNKYITEKTTVLGVNWFDRLNDVKLYSLTSSRLKSNLSSLMAQYDVREKNRATNLGGMYGSTPAYQKYFDLNCPYSKLYGCNHLNDWYNKNKPTNYHDITKMSENEILKTYAEEVNTMLQHYNAIYAIASGKYWTGQTYIDEGCVCPSGNCPDKPTKPDPIPYNCTPKYNLGDCITGETVFYTDANGRENSQEYWDNCVFSDRGQYDSNVNHKVSQGGSLEYYEESLGSDYCPVYCVETLTANFDKGNFTVQAGNNFVWGNSNINGSRTCKTKEIDWNEFTSDLNSANDNLANKYLIYKEEETKKYSIDHAIQEKNSSDCPITSSKTISSTVRNGVCSGNCNADPGPGWSCSSASSTSCGENCTKYTKRCTKTTGYKTKYTPEAYDFTVTVNGVSKQIKGQVNSWCGDNKPSTNYSQAQRDYNTAKSNVTAIYNSMVSCYTWDKNDLYNLHPSLTLNYSDGYYNYSDTMNGYTTENQIVDNISQCQSTTVKLEKCNDSGCKLENNPIKKCNNVTMTKSITKDFSISNDAFRYVLKDSHLSIHAYELSNYNNSLFKTNYTDVGYGNLPVSYSTKDGIYGVNGKGELSIYYSDLGHDNGSSTTDIDEIFNISNSTGKWECPYRVESELIPDKNIRNPKGINVIYRPIDLYDPFPDMDSTGRETGSNWCSGRGRNADCSSRNNTVDKYILKNRDVVGEDVYKKTPMYTFIITPARAKEIRKYNKSNGYDTYTGSLNGKNYDYVCKDKTGGTCISEYLTHIIDITDARNEPGSCVQDKTRNVNDVTSFDNCRY